MFRFSTLLLPTVLSLTLACKSMRESPPHVATGTIGTVEVTIRYGSPSVKSREIFGDLVSYGEVWRTGANEATTIEFTRDVMIEGQPLPAGKYGLFTIPGPEQWTLIFNKVWDQWGAYEYNAAEDVLRVQVSPQPLGNLVEEMTFSVENNQVKLEWEKTSVSFSVAAGE